jgi:predicted amidohydrolase YtcJ
VTNSPSASDRLLIVLADRVHTLADPPTPAHVEAILIRNGIVHEVGAADDLAALAPHAELLDLRGTTITPGFTDAHIHIVEWALARAEAELSAADSPHDAATLLVDHLAAHAPMGGWADGQKQPAWIRGRGWNPHRWSEEPTASILDNVISDRPVALQSHDMHSLWVNTRALEIADINEGTPDPEGGRIGRDEHGHPTGLLFENAGQLVVVCIPNPTEEEALHAVLAAQRELHSRGITGIHSFPGFYIPEPEPLRILERMYDEGMLALRVLQHIPLHQLDDAIRLGLRSGVGHEWIRIGALKMFLDGALGSRTAWMLEPYVGTSDCGLNVLPEQEFRSAVSRAAAAGIASTVHAIGDAAVCLALDVLSDPYLEPTPLPHRIEHVQCCPTTRLADAGKAGIVCSVQPAHMITDWRPADRHWGERARGAYAFRSLLRAGAVLACGSDAPVEPVDPLLGLYAATTRQDLAGAPGAGWYADERIAVEDVIRGYTRGAAFVAGAEGEQGVIAPGAHADIVAWNKDPFQTTGKDLLNLRVARTIVAGKTVYDDSA